MRNLKKLLGSLLAVLLCLALFAVPVAAEESTETESVPLPTATVSKIDNDALTVAVKFLADNPTVEQTQTYNGWYANYVLTFSEPVSLNADGTADGYISYKSDDSWQYVDPVSGVTSVSILDEDLGTTYTDIHTPKKSFDCGVYLSPAFLQANPDITVTLELRIFNNEEGSTENYAIGSYEFTIPPLPTATVTPIEKPELTFALNFLANTATDAQLAYYKDWYADFVLTVNKDVTFNVNGNADGYLSGQYDANADSWVNVPFEDVTLNAGTSLKIMEYAAELMDEPGLKFNYEAVFSLVKEFNCGVYFKPEYLEANPDFVVTLALRIYNNTDESVSYPIGPVYTFTAQSLFTASVTDTEGNVKHYIDLSDAITNANTGDTVKLLKNVTAGEVTIDKQVTIDLNGQTVNFTGNGFVVNDGGALTVTGSGNVVAAVQAASGSVVISGGTWSSANQDSSEGSGALFSGNVVINGGYFAEKPADTFIATGYSAIDVGDYYYVHQHNLQPVAQKDATCVATGIKAYWKCNVCGLMYESENSDAPVTEEGLNIPATGVHTYVEKADAAYIKSQATCVDAAYYYESCKDCGVKGEDTFTSGNPLAHTLYPVAEVPATLIAPGSIAHNKCSQCNQCFDPITDALLTDVTIPQLVAAESITLGMTKVEMDQYVGWGIPVIGSPDGTVVGNVTVVSSDPAIVEAGYDTEGDMLTLMGLKPGSVTVTVTTANGAAATCEVTVKPLTVLSVGAAEKIELKAWDGKPYSFTPKADGVYTLYHTNADAAFDIHVIDMKSGPVIGETLTTEGQYGFQYTIKGGTEYIIHIINPSEKDISNTLNVGMVSHTHTLTKVEAKAATYTEAGNIEYYACAACDKKFSDAEATKEVTNVILPQLIEVVGDKAEVSEGAVDVAIEAAGTTGNVTLDLTHDDVIGEENAPVSSAELPVAALEKVAEADASLTLTKADATVTLDTKALEAVAKQAEGSTVTLVVEQIEKETLSVAQQNAVKDKQVAAVISAELICNATNKKIGSEAEGGFGGGSVTVQIPFTPETGYKGSDYVVMYVADNGAIQQIKTEYKDGSLVIELAHFSEYVIVNTSYTKPSTGTNPATGDNGLFLPLSMMLFCGIAMVGMIAGKKKYGF